MCTEKTTEKIRLRSLHIMNLLICFFLLASNFPIQSTHATFLPFFRAPLGAFSCELIKLSDLYWAVFPLFPIISVRTAVIVVCFICPNCLSLRDNAACCIPLCVICAICGRIHIQTYSIYIAQMKPQKSPADHADLRRRTTKHQNNKPQNTTTTLTPSRTRT